MSGAFTPKVRSVCWQRSRGCCEVCGRPLPEKGWNLHHRKNRGMGGTKHKPTAAEGLAVCGSGTTGCHGRITDHPQWARNHGFLLRRGDDATQVPVRRWWAWVLLLDDGTVVPCRERGSVPDAV